MVENKNGPVAVGFTILLVGLAVYIAFVGFGTLVASVKYGLPATLGDSVAYRVSQWAITLSLWAIAAGLVIGVLHVAGNSIATAAEAAKRKPIVTLAAFFGIVAGFLGDLCKDSLPSAGPLEKNLFKLISAVMFAVAGWFYDSPVLRFRMIGVTLWIFFPLIIVYAISIPSVAQEQAKPGVPMEAWIYVIAWGALVAPVLVLARLVKRQESAETSSPTEKS